MLCSVLAVARSVGAALNALVQERGPRAPLWRLLGASVAIAAGVYTAREGTTMARRVLARRLGKPALVRETTRVSGFGAMLSRGTAAAAWAVVLAPVRAARSLLDGLVALCAVVYGALRYVLRGCKRAENGVEAGSKAKGGTKAADAKRRARRRRHVTADGDAV